MPHYLSLVVCWIMLTPESLLRSSLCFLTRLNNAISMLSIIQPRIYSTVALLFYFGDALQSDDNKEPKIPTCS